MTPDARLRLLLLLLLRALKLQLLLLLQILMRHLTLMGGRRGLSGSDVVPGVGRRREAVTGAGILRLLLRLARVRLLEQSTADAAAIQRQPRLLLLLYRISADARFCLLLQQVVKHRDLVLKLLIVPQDLFLLLGHLLADLPLLI